MNSLPEELPSDGLEAFTGLVCPDCSGNLVVSVQQRHVSFSCRVGHAYSVDEVVAAKEAVLEATLWRAVFAFEELHAFLTDLERHRLTEQWGSDACRARQDLARQQALRVRAVIDADRPLVEGKRSQGRGEPAAKSP